MNVDSPPALGNFRCGTIAVVGRPNVGKSTLVNHLVGQKVSITSNKAQTTRHRVTGVLTEEDAQYIFVDTPGYQTTHRNALNRVLNRTVTNSAEDADVVIFAVEALRFGEADEVALKTIADRQNIVLVVTKMDRAKDDPKLMPFLSEMEARGQFAAIVPVSVKHAESLKELLRALKSLLPLQSPIYDADAFTDKSERFLAAEFIREKVFRQLGDEIPYSVSVLIDKFEVEGNLRRIFASLVVEKSSQKAILIGEKGERLKRIASDARKEMEATFGGKVYLEVWVRIKKGWADDDALVKQYGYQ